MPETVILQSLEPDERSEIPAENFKRIKEKMKELSKETESISFEDVLEDLGMTKAQYIVALRSTLTNRPEVFLKRGSLEVNINFYNLDILNLFEANMDIKFVLEEYGIAAYIVNYIQKTEAGLCSLLRDAVKEAEKGNVGIKDKFRSLNNVLLNSSLMSAQQAAYYILSLHLNYQTSAEQ